MLTLDESLPIVESALRCGDVTPIGLRAIAEAMRGRGRARARGLAELASGRTANAYESVLHALAATVPGLRVEPQVTLRLPGGATIRPDLVDLELGIVIEAESFAWHGDTAALTRDCERYNTLIVAGLIVVRFSWSQVMFKPDYVLAVLASAVCRARSHANVA
jgi:very-short-patch-repair endonuclease